MGSEGKPARKTNAHQETTSPMAEDALFYCSSLLESVSDAIIVTDMQFVIISWNQAAEEIYGWTAEDVIGKPIAAVVPTDYPGATLESVLALFETDGVWKGEVIQRHRDGTPRHILASVNQLKNDANEPVGVVAINRDITERKQAEETLRRQHQYLLALQETSLDLVSQLDLNQLLENIVLRAGELVGTSAGFLDLVDPETGRLLPRVGLGALAESLKFEAQPGEGLSGIVWHTGQPLVINDYDNWPDRIDRFADRLIQSIIGVPLQSGTDVLGVLGLAYEAETHATFEPETFEILNQFARLATIAIKNARVFSWAKAELAERSQAENALRERESTLNALLNAPQETVALLGRDGQVLSINANGAQRLGATPDELIGQNVFTVMPPEVRRARKALIGQVFETGDPVHFEDRRANRYYANSVYPIFDKQGEEVTSVAIYASDITDRKRAERALQESQRTLSTLMSNLPGMAYSCLHDRQWTMLFVSQGCADLIGYDAADLIQNRTVAYEDVIHPDDREAVWDTIQTHVAAGQPFRVNYRIVARDGVEKWVWELGREVVLPDGTSVLEGFLTDITERRWAEERLKESEEKYRLLFDSADELVSVYDDQGVCQLMNRRLATLLGGEPEDFIGASFDKLHPKEAPEYTRRIREAIESGLSQEYEDEVEFPLGKHWLLSGVHPVPDAHGVFRTAQIISQDITARKRAEEALRKSEERYRKIAELISDYAYAYQIISDGRPQLEWVVGGFERITGYTPQESAERDGWAHLIHPEDIPIAQLRAERLAAGEQDVSEFRILKENGEVRWLRDHGYPVWDDEEGRVARIYGAVQDITTRKKMERALQQSEERFRLSFEYSQLGMALMSLEGTFITINQRFCDILGYARSELLAKDYLSITHPDDRDRSMAHFNRLLAGDYDGYSIEKRYLHKHGGVIWSVLSIALIRDATGEPIYATVQLSDITERKQVEEALKRYATRLSTLHFIDTAILSAQTPKEIAQIALEYVHELIDPFRLSVLELDPNSGTGQILKASVTGEIQLDEDVIVSLETIVGYEDLKQGKTVQLEDLLAVESTPLVQRLIDEGVRSVLNVPLFAQGMLVGMLGLGHDQPGEPFAEYIDVLCEIGDQMAVAIVQSQLREAEHEQRVLAEALSETAHIVNRTLKPDEVLHRMITAVGRVFPHSGVNVMLTEQDGEFARVVQFCPCYAQNNLPDPAVDRLIRIADRPVLRQMRDTGRALAISDVQDFPDWVERADRDWVRSYIGAPIMSEGKVLGFLNLDSATAGFFTTIQARYLHAFANQAALAIQNARLYQELGSYSAYLEQAVAERTAELQESEERFRAVVEDQTELICRFTADGILTFVNEAYCRYFGKPVEELIGRSFMPRVPREDQRKVDQQLATLSPDNPIVTIEHRVFASNGELRWVEWTNRMLFDTRTSSTEIQGAGRDVTERKLAEQTLRQALEREMEVGHMRMRFLSIASHDLRNPLAVIQSGVDMLDKYRDRMSEEKKEAKFKQIRTSITHMVELLDDVLLIGRAEVGKLAFNPEPVELETFCHSIMAEIQTSIGTDYCFDFSLTGKRVTRLVDPKLLRHILYNLLSNAVKYSPAQSTVTFDLISDADRTVFRIQDEGIGIPIADLPRLFEAFHRASNVGVTSGTGLGLSIVKRSVELHGGTVNCESQEGIGTTFTVTLFHKPEDRI